MEIKERIVLEAPSIDDRQFVLEKIDRGTSVFLIERFYAYHHQGDMMFFPPLTPQFVQDLLAKGQVKLIKASSLSSRVIFFSAAEKAVKCVEKLYPIYFSQHKELISVITSQLNSEKAEYIFKKRLCDQLAIFFSVNMMLEKVRNLLGKGELIYHAPIEVDLYKSIQAMIKEIGGIPINVDHHIRFSTPATKKSRLAARKKWVSIFVKILFQFLASCALNSKRNSKKKKFKYGIAVVSPQRQFRGNNRGPEFLVDDHRIMRGEVAYIPIVPIGQDHLLALHRLGSYVIELPKKGRFFSDRRIWWQLLKCSLRERPFGFRELEAAAANLFNYLRWNYVLDNVDLQHFITHADFGDYHISRNIALNQHGIQTWYYTDASNFSLNFRENDIKWNLHPFWAYLHYDHFITWYSDLGKYFSLHSGALKNIKVVGCLWSQHITGGESRIFSSEFKDGQQYLRNKFKIAVFTSTYTVNGVTSYDEGIAFLRDIRSLADEFEDVVIVVKEKKAREFHLQLDPVKGRHLLEILDKMTQNQRVRVMTRDANTSLLIGEADLCISFPFTSPTIEALSVDHPAIWHDAESHYRHNVYSVYENIVTHGYGELKRAVSIHIKNRNKKYKNPIPKDHPLIDPFRDGKAIERFRDLLCAAE